MKTDVSGDWAIVEIKRCLSETITEPGSALPSAVQGEPLPTIMSWVGTVEGRGKALQSHALGSLLFGPSSVLPPLSPTSNLKLQMTRLPGQGQAAVALR